MHDEQRPREPEIAPELNALEQQLHRMTPAAPRIDRDRLMYAAGHAAALGESGRDGWAMYHRAGSSHAVASPSWGARRFWPAATFIMTAATLLLATMLVWQRQAHPFASQVDVLPPFTTQASEQPRMAIAPAPSESATSSFGSPTLLHPSNGYLGIRYAALTRGVDAWRPTPQTSAGDGDLYDEAPRTQCKMLEELLPSRKRQMNPQSSF
jgi:hypothetical protein